MTPRSRAMKPGFASLSASHAYGRAVVPTGKTLVGFHPGPDGDFDGVLALMFRSPLRHAARGGRHQHPSATLHGLFRAEGSASPVPRAAQAFPTLANL